MKPPFQITSAILNLCAEITLLLGKIEGLQQPIPQPELRKHNRIRTIQSSLAIEGNTLTIEQVTDIINNKKVLGPAKDILEVKNTIKAYEKLTQYDAMSLKSLLEAHNILMTDLLTQAGKLRTKNVGVKAGEKIVHMAPPHDQVPTLVNELFLFLREEKDLHPLIKSSVFHYEFECIHPFMDGNGRLGRLWQSVILYNYRGIFEYIPIESVVRQRQAQYYQALQKSDQNGEATEFINFMLEAIYDAVIEFIKEFRPVVPSAATRLQSAKDRFKKTVFSRSDYLQANVGISNPTASRDLAEGVKTKLLKKTGDKALTKYQFI